MVHEQLFHRGIEDKKVLEAFGKVERHRFVPENLRDNAYSDYPLLIGEGQTISQPYIVALMTQSLELRKDDRVLEIGTGSGYQTAILAELSKQVFTIERHLALLNKAQDILNELGYANIKTKSADGTLGWPQEAPFDKIIITAAAPRVPLPLVDQLKEGGKMILPLGETFGQELTLFDKIKGILQPSYLCGCMFVPLIGKYSYPGSSQ
jgi:protein-L-isoaspartate(D-aspartate) O-methyltransferase